MRPAEFKVIRWVLQEAIDDIDADLKRSQAMENDKELEELFNRLVLSGESSGVKLPEAPEEAKPFCGYPCSSPLLEDTYLWRHSSKRAADWLLETGEILLGDVIKDVLSKLPTEAVDGNQPEEMTGHLDAIRATAERIRKIMTDCLSYHGAEFKDWLGDELGLKRG